MNELPRLIGLTGRAGCGKDTLADALTRSRFVKRPLADPLKAGLNAMFGWSPADWLDREWKERPQGELCGKSPRQLAQTLGTEWGRNTVGADLWLMVLEREINRIRLLAPRVGIVVPDVRFDNEAKRIREMGGVVVYIDRPAAGAVSQHASESGINAAYIDGYVLNDGSVDEFIVRSYQLLRLLTETLQT